MAAQIPHCPVMYSSHRLKRMEDFLPVLLKTLENTAPVDYHKTIKKLPTEIIRR
jgi:hypothetical protein